MATLPPQYHLYLTCIRRAARVMNVREGEEVWGIERIIQLVKHVVEYADAMIPVAVDRTVLDDENSQPALAIKRQLSARIKTPEETMTTLDKNKEVGPAISKFAQFIVRSGHTQVPATIVEQFLRIISRTPIMTPLPPLYALV